MYFHGRAKSMKKSVYFVLNFDLAFMISSIKIPLFVIQEDHSIWDAFLMFNGLIWYYTIGSFFKNRVTFKLNLSLLLHELSLRSMDLWTISEELHMPENTFNPNFISIPIHWYKLSNSNGSDFHLISNFVDTVSYTVAGCSKSVSTRHNFENLQWNKFLGFKDL